MAPRVLLLVAAVAAALAVIAHAGDNGLARTPPLVIFERLARSFIALSARAFNAFIS